MELYSLEELLVIIYLRASNCSLELIAALVGRSVGSLKSKFKALPTDLTPNRVSQKDTKGFASIKELYEAFGEHCPETREEIEQDIWNRFKKWEQKILDGEV